MKIRPSGEQHTTEGAPMAGASAIISAFHPGAHWGSFGSFSASKA
jgi:hypothetical protein